MEKELKKRLGAVKLVIFDVDGVLTDGRIFKTGSGDEILAFNVKDGMGITRLKDEGIEVAFITGRVSGPLMARAMELGVDRVAMGKRDKDDAVEAMVKDVGVDLEEAAFLGDDLLDIPAMKKVGLAAAVADAVPEVKAAAHIVLDTAGGAGAARELAERVLKAQKRWIT